MACSSCGMPCQGGKCRSCDRAEHQEDYYGVPADNFDDVDEDVQEDDESDWAVVQQGLDGESHTGQATLEGGVSKDGGDD